MQSSFTSRTYNITALLGRSSFPDYLTHRVVIPEFQRPFSWTKSHVAVFWDDIIEFHKKLKSKNAQETYFFGPIVILEEDDCIKLLDGQQRLATATILLALLRDMARKHEKSGGDLARDIHRDYISLDDESHSFALTLGELDDAYFKATIQEDAPEQQTVKYASHNLIRQAKLILETKVEEYVSGCSHKEALVRLKSLLQTVTNFLKLVAIQVNSEEEAFLIFETLNDRGLRLAVPDLLLNYLMKTATSGDERRAVRQSWNTVVENLGSGKTSSFIRHMWVSQHGDVKSQGLFREIKEKFDEQEIESVEFARGCAEESKEYTAILKVSKELPEQAAKFITPLVDELDSDQALPILLSGLRCLNEADFIQLARCVQVLMARHSVLANLNPIELENVLFSAARTIREIAKNKQDSNKALKAVKARLSSINPSNEVIKTALPDLTLTKKEAVFLLYAIADTCQSMTKAVTVKDNSIEHIFPENAEEKEWPEAETLYPYVWNIGNLSILESTYNRTVGNNNFDFKKPFYQKSAIQLSQDIAKLYKSWDVTSIKARASSMMKYIEQIWPERI